MSRPTNAGSARTLALTLVAALALTACGGGDATPTTSASTAAPSATAVTELTVDGGPRSQPLRSGDAIPDFTAPGLDGEAVAWADREGKPTLLVVWAPWCPHCQVELPVVETVSHDYPDVAVTSIASGIGANPGPTPQELVESGGLTFPVALDDEQYTLLQALGVRSFPMLYFVASDGTVHGAHSGELPEEQLRAALDELAALPAGDAGASGDVVADAIEIEVQNGKVAGGGPITVGKGDEVTLVVTSDVADEVHVHGYDVMEEVRPGKPATVSFTADAPGIFEVELEEAGLPLAEITVEP